MRKALLLLLMLLLSISVYAELHKMSDSGDTLALESESWSCVLDDETSLVWEVKSEKKGVQYALNTYTWFDGESGRDNGTFTKNCYWGKNCNTQVIHQGYKQGRALRLFRLEIANKGGA
ncbi:MAG: hypothetical protein ACJ0HV_01340 [Candidatus Pseudothioglobus sp.]